MLRCRRRFAAPCLALVAGLLSGACDNQTETPRPDPLDLSVTVPNETLVPPEQTLPSPSQIPDATARALLLDVTATIGVAFPAGASECVVGSLVDAIPREDLIEFGPTGDLADATQTFQTQVFGAFDGCVDGDALALAGSPILVAAGATDAKGTCFFRLVRDELGIGGFYRYSAAREGDFEADNRLVLIIASITQRCGLDVSALSVTTTTAAPLPTDPPEPGATTTSSTVAATTTDPNVPQTTRQVVTVVTNAPLVTLATTSTTPLPAPSTASG